MADPFRQRFRLTKPLTWRDVAIELSKGLPGTPLPVLLAMPEFEAVAWFEALKAASERMAEAIRNANTNNK